MHIRKQTKKVIIIIIIIIIIITIITITIAIPLTHVYYSIQFNSLLFMCRGNSHKANYRHSTV
jgi:flagellar basal body-associated protein FliL